MIKFVFTLLILTLY